MYRTALARSHRPRRFSEIVGQDHVAATLLAAVDGGRVHHAYLFCGPRGIGKTTAARVLAMALNCPDRKAGEPCGVCESCERIWSGRTSLDVVEIDAASNRGVDDARDLRERAMYAPSDESRYKVYIVDEAHMLTRDAWNALLKILEEPPPRVIFVFATTDPGKIRQSASPVLSRVQRFDFRRVSIDNLVTRLRQVAALEGVTAEQGALLPIARRAEGGVRDALSLLDQVLSFSGDAVTSDDVRRMLGLVEEDRYIELLGIVARGDRAAVFPFVQSLLDAGYDLAEFVRGLGEALRLALALRMDPTEGAAELAEESRVRLGRAAAAHREEDLLRMLVATADFESAGRFRRTDQPRIQVEVLLLRLVSMDSSVTLTELLAALGGDDDQAVRRPGEGSQDRGPAAPAARGQGTTRRAEGTESPPPREPARDQSGLRSTWLEAITAAQGKGVGGKLLGLKAAAVELVDAATIRLHVPAGLAPDLQGYLDDLRLSAAFRLELAGRLDLKEGSLRFEVRDSGPRARITAEEAREQRLQGLMETDPRLREAVETLDLKLKE